MPVKTARSSSKPYFPLPTLLKLIYYCKMCSSIALFLVAQCCNAFGVPRVPLLSREAKQSSLSAAELVEKSIQAMGGDDTLRKIESITYSAPR
jgi:hypothetical protein